MNHEKPQKGNPHKLSVLQHTFPAASISRFIGDDGRVETYLIAQRKSVRLKPNDQLFCARRVWDHQAETGFMKEVEDNYQSLANAITSENRRKLSPQEQRVISDMYALWNIREHIKENPIPDQQIQGIIGVSRRYTKDEQEHFEKNQTTVIRPDLAIAGRHLAGRHIQRNLEEVRIHMSNAHWGILEAKKGNFVVPDNCSSARIMPLTPTLCLASQSPNIKINKDQVILINKELIKNSKNYYFARSLNKII